jgi:hypothetical protein
MPGPAPKDSSTRARRNKTSTAAVLSRDPKLIVPELPMDYPWHGMTVRWWNDIWSSPMAPEYDDSDQHGLFMLAILVDDFWTADKPSGRTALAAEIRQQSQRFGLSPIDRRRLQWEIERAEDAQAQGASRRAKAPAPKPGAAPADPRAILRAV